MGRSGLQSTLLSRFDLNSTSRPECPFHGFRMFLIIENPQGIAVIHSVINERTCREIDGQGRYHITVDMPALWLTPGMYSAHVKLICNGIGLERKILFGQVAGHG